MCRCCLADVETVDHYLFFCPFFNFHRTQIKYCCKKITKGWPPKLKNPSTQTNLALIYYIHLSIQTSNPIIFVFLVSNVTDKLTFFNTNMSTLSTEQAKPLKKKNPTQRRSFQL